MDVACVLPALAEGSGGHRTILSNLSAVADRGADVALVVDDQYVDLDTQLAIAESLVLGSAQKFTWVPGWDETVTCDIALATSATSTEPARENVQATTYAYFVQDWESWFNPMGDNYLAAELSYLQDWRFITIGDWLRYRLLRIDPNRRVGSVHFGAEVDVNRAAAPHFRSTAPVVMNWQPEKTRRLARFTLEVAERLREEYPDIPVLLFGSEHLLPADCPLQNLGMLSEAQMLDLFAEAACVVHFSSSNPSRIPFETVACATPAIELFGQSTCFDFPQRGVHTVIPTVDQMVQAVVAVFEDPRTYLQDAVSAMGGLRSRRDEMERFADLLLDPELCEPAPLPNRTRPDLIYGDLHDVAARYLHGVRNEIGVVE